MGKKKRNKANNTKNSKRKFPLKAFFAILGILGSLYAYQYYWRPEINLKNIDAQYARETKTNDMRINFSFLLKNDGESKTKNLMLFSAFPKWGLQKTNITVAPYDFTQSDIQNLIRNEETTFATYKDINFDDFVQNHNMAEGIWLSIVLRWQSDNLVYIGRTFEKHILIFLRLGMDENKMIFQAQQIKEEDFTFWFLKNNTKPNIFKTIEDIGASRLLYGEISRFD